MKAQPPPQEPIDFRTVLTNINLLDPQIYFICCTFLCHLLGRPLPTSAFLSKQNKKRLHFYCITRHGLRVEHIYKYEWLIISIANVCNTGMAWKQIDLGVLCVFMFMRCGAPVAVLFFRHFTPKMKKIKSIFHEQNRYGSTWKSAYYSEKRLEARWNKAHSQYNRSRRVIMTRSGKTLSCELQRWPGSCAAIDEAFISSLWLFATQKRAIKCIIFSAHLNS